MMLDIIFERCVCGVEGGWEAVGGEEVGEKVHKGNTNYQKHIYLFTMMSTSI